MYHFHHTEAIIVASRLSGEANRQLRIFTRDLGMITAHAQGVRLISSKLRYALQPYSLCQLVLVQGKHGWRVTNAVPLLSFASGVRGRSHSRKTLVSILGFLARFMPESVVEGRLFDAVKDAFVHITNAHFSDADEDQLRRVVELRALFAFGYVESQPILKAILEDVLTEDLVLSSYVKKDQIEEAIRLGTYESHL